MKLCRWIMLLCMVVVAIRGSGHVNAVEKRNVKNYEELKIALRETREMVLCLQADIVVEECLVAKGRKVIDGGGNYEIRRMIDRQNTYTGALLRGQGELLHLQAVTIRGGGGRVEAPSSILGKLIEVKRGTVVLDKGTILKENYNMTSKSTGGGGLQVKGSGRAVMKAGSMICDNLSMSGGAGVRVDRGGFFVMEGGAIRDNAVVGQFPDKDFDGRGGGIYNAGTVILQGGTIEGNLARAYRSKGVRYGGKGNEIYNDGVLRMDGKICVNSVYLTKNRRIDLTKSWEYERRCEVQVEEVAEETVLVCASQGCCDDWVHAFIWKADSRFYLKKQEKTLWLKRKQTVKPTPHVGNSKSTIASQNSKCPPNPMITPPVSAPRKPLVTKKPYYNKRKLKEKEQVVPSTLPTPMPVVTSVLETPVIESVEEKGEVQFIYDPNGSNLFESSIWRQVEYAKLLQQTFQKDESMYEQVWVISAKDMGLMRKMAKGFQEKSLLERCELFLMKFGKRCVSE